MILANAAIRHAIDSGQWTAHRDGVQVSSGDLKISQHSVDVTLGGRFITVGMQHPNTRIDPYDPDTMRCSEFEADHIILNPGQFVLGYVRERFNCNAPIGWCWPNDHFTQMYDGRSTMGRLGIISHCTAGYGDYGFDGNFTLELANLNTCPIKLYAGMRIGQVSFVAIAGLDTADAYSGAYVGQYDGPRAPSIGRGRF